MEIISRIIPAKPRNKELHFLRSTGSYSGGSSSSGSSGGIGSPSYWDLITTDEENNILDNPYIIADYPIVTKTEEGDNFIQIGDAKLIYDIENNAIKLIKVDGTPLHLYATGEVSAYGLGSGGGGGEGSLVIWGTELDGGIGLTVDGIAKTLALKSGLDLKQNKLIAGSGITIVGNTISSTATGGGGTVVSWGTESGNFIPLTVEGISKTVALQGHTHSKSEVGLGNVLNVASYSKVETDSLLNSKFNVPTGTTSQYIRGDGSLATYTDTTYSLMSLSELNTGTATTSRVVNSKNLNDWLNGKNYALSNHTHTFASLTSKPTTIAGYGITNGALTTTNIIAGNGLTGGGTLAANRTITLGTPSNITLSSTNSVTTNSHTHNLVLGGTSSQYLNGATTLVTIPTVTAGNGLTGGGQLTASQTLTLGTPGTLTATSTNNVTASSHTHAITTTSVGAANTIVQTDATGGTKLNNLMVGGAWKLEQVGTELQLKYNNTVAQRFLLDGSIVGLGEITAYGATTGGEGVSLLRTGGTMTGDLVMSNGTSLGINNLPLRLLGNTLTYNGSNILTEANTATQIKMGNGWTIEQTNTSLTIRKNGVIKGTFNA